VVEDWIRNVEIRGDLLRVERTERAVDVSRARGLALTLWFVGIAAVGQACAAVPAEECGRKPSHAEERGCHVELARSSTAELGGVERELAGQVEQWDQEAEYKQRTRSLLLASFERFKSFRDAQCEAEASLAAGGNAARDLRLSCVTRLNRRRIAELRAVGLDLR